MGTLLNRRRYLGGRKIPYEADILYLESTGTQWIDTGIYPTINLSFEITLQRTNTPSGDELAFGSRRSGGGAKEDFSLWTNTASGRGFAVHYAYTPTSTEDSSWVYKNSIVDTFHKVFVTPQTISVDDVVCYTWKNQNRTEFTSLSSLGVFCMKTENTIDPRLFIGKVSSVKIWNGNTIVFDAIPIRKGTTGYLYDKVSGQLFGNAGTGEFVLGPDKQP